MRKEPVLRLKIFTVLVLGALGPLALGAQEPPPALPSSSFGASIDVRVVNVEAVVTDAKGSRVRGLAAGDFILEVDGREVPIEYFSEMEAAKAVAPPARPGEAPQMAAAPSLAPEGRSILVFIDDIFATAQQRDRVLDGVERDLQLLGPADRMAIVAFVDDRVDVLSRWTGDRAALAAALQAARKRRAHGNPAPAGPPGARGGGAVLRGGLAGGAETAGLRQPRPGGPAGREGGGAVRARGPGEQRSGRRLRRRIEPVHRGSAGRAAGHAQHVQRGDPERPHRLPAAQDL